MRPARNFCTVPQHSLSLCSLRLRPTRSLSPPHNFSSRVSPATMAKEKTAALERAKKASATEKAKGWRGARGSERRRPARSGVAEGERERGGERRRREGVRPGGSWALLARPGRRGERAGRLVAWRHGGARASATRLSDWREDNDDWHWASGPAGYTVPGRSAQVSFLL